MDFNGEVQIGGTKMAKPELKTDNATVHMKQVVPFALHVELRELSDPDFELVLKSVISEHLHRNKLIQDGFGAWTGA